ncbi:hypothetical protein L1887_43791 [Cichorium endivia]|nr:hypothetical protein L1887_43791 [Cichorium endivia]
MQTWKKKLVVSQLALACTLAIASQANAKDIPHRECVISTYYLDDGINGRANALSISNSTINGMITSECMTSSCADGLDTDGTNHSQYDRFSLTVDNSTINDTYEHYAYDVVNGENTERHYLDTYNLGIAIPWTWSPILLSRIIPHIAGITLTQGYQELDNTPYDGIEGVANSSKVFTDTLVVKDSVLTSGAYSDLGTSGFYGQTAKPGDYDHCHVRSLHRYWRYSVLQHLRQQLLSERRIRQTDTTDDGIYNPTTNGWDGTDKLDVTLTNGSKWVGAAQSSVEAIGTAQINGHVTGEAVYQSGLFNIALDNGSEWDTRKLSNIDTLTVNNQSQVNVEDSGLLADSITLTNASSMNIGTAVAWRPTICIWTAIAVRPLTEETAELYANTITVDNGAELALGLGQVDTHNLELTDGGVP